MKRDLLAEAGYRCSIPACRIPEPLELEHIDDWAKVREHRFENMIVLCRNCHHLFKAKRIDKRFIRHIKANLAVLSGRYSEIERRLVEMLYERGDESVMLDANDLTHLSMRNLLRDGLVAVIRPPQIETRISVPGNPIRTRTGADGAAYASGGRYTGGYELWNLTGAGRELAKRWFSAELISPDSAE